MAERLKSLLIALLALSLLTLTFAVWQHDAPAQWDSAGPMAAAARALGLVTPPPQTLPLTSALQYGEAACPARIVWTRDGQHWGAQYDPALLDGVFDSLKESLRGALGSAGQPVRQTEAAWREALSDDSLYLEYNDAPPLRALALWLSGETPALPDTTVRRLAFVFREDTVSLWFVDRDGTPYLCSTALPTPRDIMGAAPPGLSPCRFGFESSLPRTPYALLFAGPPSPPEASCQPAALLSVTDAFLRELRISAGPDNCFPNEEGGMTYVDDDDARACRFSPREHIRLTSSEQPASVPPPQPPEAVEQARALLSALSPLLGEARFSLQDTAVSADGTALTVTFAYELSGIPVRLSDGTPPATLVFRNGQLAEAHIRVLSFSLSDRLTPLMTEDWAYVALTALHPYGDLELRLSYREEDGRLTAGWDS